MCHSNLLLKISVFAAALLPTSAALAHPGHGMETFAASFLHPITGPDHLLAAVAVGLFVAGLAKSWRGLLLAPLAFLSGVFFGACLAPVAALSRFYEMGISASLLGLGALLVFRPKQGFGLISAVFVVFGTFHGYAHGHELAQGQGTALLGFLSATALLHFAGAFGVVALGRLLPAKIVRGLLRISGAGLCGAAFFI